MYEQMHVQNRVKKQPVKNHFIFCGICSAHLHACRYGESAVYKLGYILLQLALTPLLSVALAARFLLEDTRRLIAPASPTVAAAIRLTRRKADVWR
jgi:hypothetical protein